LKPSEIQEERSTGDGTPEPFDDGTPEPFDEETGSPSREDPLPTLRDIFGYEDDDQMGETGDGVVREVEIADEMDDEEDETSSVNNSLKQLVFFFF
jgi:hypothetical protein